MTTEQKVAQMIQPEIRDITVEDMRKYVFGSYLNGDGAFPNGDKRASVGGLKAGAQSVMASFNSWDCDKIHRNKYLLTTVLKDRMGFDGFVVGDWIGHGQIQGCTNESCSQAINAGLDMFMAPTKSWKPLFYNTVNQVKDGTIPLSRVNDAVSRILRVKLRAGLFRKPSLTQRLYAGDSNMMGNQQHRALAREAVRKSMVLLKNKVRILPLSPKQNILITGDGAHNIGKQSGGWTITWQATNNTNADFPRWNFNL
ncbi:hypothetical protein N482_02105 [Pseudoalteromonas luteoviolacea NCIMB 1942]|uniref:Glycoside hydrolase family 3 N-terminal domain-containing protein n=1 Tax=Pseudoalteromonas luteoviolacea NCIMB 1942 TaxID=1365253 RepID=A0A167BY87_9GAMM|nr:hypothetical protein N482_02105 [Pseudoalteromonas luteoviolacea NCIMB 1942]